MLTSDQGAPQTLLSEACSDAWHCLPLSALGMQIESELAVGRISEIAAVEGIDCIMISPDDVATRYSHLPLGLVP